MAKRASVYLVTFVALDHAPHRQLFSHFFVQHYRDSLGVDPANFLVAIQSKKSNGSLLKSKANSLLQQAGLPFAKVYLWQGVFDLQSKHQVKHSLLSRARVPLDAFIMSADVDEFFWLNKAASIDRTIQAHTLALTLQKQNIDTAYGYFIDRLAPGGQIKRLQLNESIWLQFPLHCNVVERVAGGLASKIMLHRGSVRTNAGNHLTLSRNETLQLLQSQKLLVARSWNVLAPDGTRSVQHQHFGLFSSGWLPVTLSPHYDKPMTIGSAVTTALTPDPAGVHHMKWHAGLLTLTDERLRHYRGDDRGKRGRPRYMHWKESARIIDAIQSHGRIDPSIANCRQPSYSSLS